MPRYFFILVFLLGANYVFPKPQNSFKALVIYDYFKAKQLFYKDVNKNQDAYSCYGLSIIYSRNDNPFFNLDSAAKYAHRGYNYFKLKPLKQTFSGFVIDSVSILSLCDSIARMSFRKIKKSFSVNELDNFLNRNYLAGQSVIYEARYMRDELEFNKNLSLNKSDSTGQFIITHPESSFLMEALLLKDRQLYDEETKDQTERQYVSFIKKYPGNVMLNSAFESLYNIYKKNADVKGLGNFVTNYAKAPQINEAWKLLFSLSVKSFSNSELEKFLQEYPKFPFKNSILKELELNKLVLYPFQKDDFSGFIDSSATIVIKPVYDAVSEFSEGLAVVNKNDSVFYINKENANVFNQYFNEAYPFKNGIAVIKQNNKWGFINRQGQPTGPMYDEISELSNNAYVVKLNNKYGAIDYYGQIIIEPRFDKLGDFKNDFAYYIENGKYGFVLKSGYVYKAEFDWISDFNEKNIAIVKQNNAYGLINAQGLKVLEPSYDLILKAPNNIFILVKNGSYGFYNGTGCFLSLIIYDFIKEKPVEFYTNGNILKLLKKNEQAFMDLNGRISIDFGSYDEINFASNALIKVKRKNKYGFVDRKLTTVIPYKYEQAKDFADSLAVVRLKNKNSLINTSGKEIYSTEGSLEKISQHYYVTEGERTDLINHKGESIFTNISGVQKINNSLIIIVLNTGEIRLLKD